MKLAERKNLWLGTAACLVLVSILLLLTKGLNFGIDFTGGTLLERRLPVATNGTEIMEQLSQLDLDLGQPVIQMAGDRDAIIRTAPLDSTEIDLVDAKLEEAYGDVEVRRTEMVGPVIGGELIRKGLWSLGLAAILMLIYVAFRFEWTFGVAAVLPLLHNVLVVCGLFALLGMEINTNFIAAILTIVGYSINDTIVIFDRIRENRRNQPKLDQDTLVDTSVTQSLTRTINTSVTTLLVLVALLILGGSTIRDLVIGLIAGIVVGTLSSLFLATPLWLWLEERKKTAYYETGTKSPKRD